jgi:hypothetical protein
MVDPNVYQQLGRLQAKVEVLEEGQSDMNAKLDTLLERSAKDHGARRALWRVGAASGTAGGVLVGVLQWLQSWRNP